MTTLPSEQLRLRVGLEVDLIMDPCADQNAIAAAIDALAAVVEGSTAQEAIAAGMEASSVGPDHAATVHGVEALSVRFVSDGASGYVPRIIARELEECYP